MIRERWVRSQAGAMLYDARYADQFHARWFEPQHWLARDAARATHGGRGASWFVDGVEPWVLRRYRRGGWVGRWIRDRYLWTGEPRARPVAEWRLLAWAHDAGLPVARPVAACLARSGPFYRAALITARVAGRSLAERAGAGAPDARDWTAAGAAIRRCHDAGLDHADLNLHNVLVGDDGAVWIIDLDRGARRSGPGAWAARNLARLARSLDKMAWSAAEKDAALVALRQGYGSND